MRAIVWHFEPFICVLGGVCAVREYLPVCVVFVVRGARVGLRGSCYLYTVKHTHPLFLTNERVGELPTPSYQRNLTFLTCITRLCKSVDKIKLS